MYVEQPSFTKPAGDNVKIWRYMDFTKFVSLLDNRKLFFARSDTLGDPFEGSYPLENIEQRKKTFLQMLEQVPPERRETLKASDTELSNLFIQIRYLMFINSWHENGQESAAMWKLYLKSNEGIAIQSTFGLLKDSFMTEKPGVYIGEIQYINYSVDKISDSFFAPFLTKRISFKHENELRALVFDLPKSAIGQSNLPGNTATGYDIPVDLNKLIVNIYVAPGNPSWFVELVKSVTKKYGLDKPVIQSALDAKPMY